MPRSPSATVTLAGSSVPWPNGRPILTHRRTSKLVNSSRKSPERAAPATETLTPSRSNTATATTGRTKPRRVSLLKKMLASIAIRCGSRAGPRVPQASPPNPPRSQFDSLLPRSIFRESRAVKSASLNEGSAGRASVTSSTRARSHVRPHAPRLQRLSPQSRARNLGLAWHRAATLLEIMLASPASELVGSRSARSSRDAGAPARPWRAEQRRCVVRETRSR